MPEATASPSPEGAAVPSARAGPETAIPAALAGGSGVGTDMGRILALSDGIFGFAMTLLVISIAVPVLTNPPPSELLDAQMLAGLINDQLGTIIIFVVAFLILGAWWVSHHELFRTIRAYNRGLVWLNLLFLALIALTPFTLSLLAKNPVNPTAIGWFAGGMALTAATFVGLALYVRSDLRLFEPTVNPRTLDFFVLRSSITSAIFALSIGIAYLAPTIAEYVWIAIFPVQLVVLRRRFGPVRPSPTQAPGAGGR